MRRKALEIGISDKDTLLEGLSMTTKENMICYVREKSIPDFDI